MKKLLLGAAMTGMLIQPALAQKSSDITATLSILSWTNDQFIASVDKATARFQERFPNVTIEHNILRLKHGGTITIPLSTGPRPATFLTFFQSQLKVSPKVPLLVFLGIWTASSIMTLTHKQS